MERKAIVQRDIKNHSRFETNEIPIRVACHDRDCGRPVQLTEDWVSFHLQPDCVYQHCIPLSSVRRSRIAPVKWVDMPPEHFNRFCRFPLYPHPSVSDWWLAVCDGAFAPCLSILCKTLRQQLTCKTSHFQCLPPDPN
jgi:hypothetical protein